MKRKMTFEVKQSYKDSLWYVTLVGGNGETMNVSEGYVSEGNAVRAAKTVRRGALFARIKVLPG